MPGGDPNAAVVDTDLDGDGVGDVDGAVVDADADVNAAPEPLAITLDLSSEREQAPVVISGADFGEAPGTIRFNEVPAPVIAWTNSEIRTTVPYGATSGDLVVRTVDGRSAAAPFEVTPGVWTRGGTDAARRREAQAAQTDATAADDLDRDRDRL